MKIRTRTTIHALLALGLLLAPMVAATPAAGQSDLESAYLRAVAEHFDLPAGEVRVLTEWAIPIGEVPVVLTISDRAGISPDPIVSLRRRGTPWSDVATRYGLDASHFHVPLDSPPATVAEAYESFTARSRSEWPSIRLSDSEMVFLVNVRMLSGFAEVPPQTAADVLERVDSPPAALRALGR